jgi:AraC-like DNA-binding protein
VENGKKSLATISDLFLQDETIKVSTMAEKVHMSERNFLRYFKAGFGCSPSEFRKIIRFRKAVGTQEGKKQLQDICYQNTYYDPSHFRKDFHELTSTSPSVFFKTISRIGPAHSPFKVDH